MSKPLRPHQERALLDLRQAIIGGARRVMLQLPTGAGKTRVAAEIVKGARSRGNRVLFTVPATGLIDQTMTAFRAEGIEEIGIIQADHPLTDPSQPVQVASVQTLRSRGIPAADVVVIDEAHRWFDLFETWMADPAWGRVPFIGLSATPWAVGLGRHYEHLIVGATALEMINAGVLSPFRVFASAHPDLTGVRTKAGDFHEGDLSKAMDRPELVAAVVGAWQRLGKGLPTLCFAVDRAHAKSLQLAFEAAGVAAGYVDANTTRGERDRIRDAFHAGALQVVVNIGTLTTGVDWDVRCVLLARPTKSEMLFVQIVGRGLRTAPGKNDCLILDCSDTHRRLGFVTDIQHDALDAGDRRLKADARSRPLPRECPTCGRLRPHREPVCPNCGTPLTQAEAAELVRLEEHEARLARAERQRWYSMLLHVAEARDYKRAWANFVFKARFGDKPNGLRRRPCPPDKEVQAFVRENLTRYAEEQNRARRGPQDDVSANQHNSLAG
ncbi:DEAD/DEAH box helicase family protein [Xanthobacter sp. V2C-8]|uniref:DEAD/DEAH box helicase n=1 Tax=Xanthobacter albus TaxID=3119929 RepID=UPI003728B3AE